MKFNQTTFKSCVYLTLTNDFHNSSVRLLAWQVDGKLRLTPSQVRHAKKILCGNYKCTCGDTFGCRGNQPFSTTYVLTPAQDGGAEIELA